MKWAVAQGYRQDDPVGEAIGAALPNRAACKSTCGRCRTATSRRRIAAGAAQALAFLWSSPAAAATFAASAVDFGTMFRTGVVTIVLTSIVVIVLSTILVPAFGAYTLR